LIGYSRAVAFRKPVFRIALVDAQAPSIRVAARSLATSRAQGAAKVARYSQRVVPLRNRLLTTRARSPAASSVCFVNWWVDGAVIGGLSIGAYVVFCLLGSSGVSPAATKVVAILTMFVNYPHFSATNYRLYQRRENLWQFPVTAIALPVLMLCFVVAALWQPDVIAPYLVTLFLICGLRTITAGRPSASR